MRGLVLFFITMLCIQLALVWNRRWLRQELLVTWLVLLPVTYLLYLFDSPPYLVFFCSLWFIVYVSCFCILFRSFDTWSSDTKK